LHVGEEVIPRDKAAQPRSLRTSGAHTLGVPCGHPPYGSRPLGWCCLACAQPENHSFSSDVTWGRKEGGGDVTTE